MFSHIHGPDCKCGTGAAGGGAGAGAGADMAAYMRMASSAAMQSRPPRRAPAASSEPFAVAPAPAFLSPFIEPQEMATRNVLAQIHPDVGISRSALTLLMRLQDALAHYLLWRAYTGANPNHRPGRSADGTRTQPQIDHDEQHADALAAQMSDPSHAIHFVFPDHVYAPELARHANSERSKAMLKHLNGHITIGGAAAADFFQFGPPLSARWFADFQTGVEEGPHGEEAKAAARRALKAREEALEKKKKKNTGLGAAAVKKKKQQAAEAAAAAAADDAASSASSASPPAPVPAGDDSKESAESGSADPLAGPKAGSLVLLPEVLQQPLEQVALCAMVEYLTAELLELAGNRTLDAAQIHMNHANIQPIDLWQSIMTDEELRDLIRFLNVSWKTRGIEDLETPYHASIVAPDAPAVSFGLPPMSFLLEEEFAASLEAQREVNEGSWYQQPKRVDELARRFARGEMRLSPMERALMELKVRPLRYWGRDTTTLLSQPPALPSEDGAPPQPEPVSFVSVGITDGADREWRFMLELSLPAWRGCVREIQTSGSPIGYIERRMVHPPTQPGRPMDTRLVDTMRVDLAMCAAIVDGAGNAYKPRVNAMSELEQDIVAQITALKQKLDLHREAKETVAVAARTQAIEGITPNVERVVEALVESVSLAAEMGAAAGDASPAAAEEKKEEEAGSGSTFGLLPSFPPPASASSAPAASPSPPPEEAFDPFTVMAVPAAAAAGGKHDSASSSSSKPGAGAGAVAVAKAAMMAVGAAAAGALESTGKRMGFSRAPTSSTAPTSASSSSSSTRGAQSASASSASAAPVLSLGSTSRLSSLSGLLGGISSHIVTSQVQSELEQTISRILHVACWSRYGPTLYTENHPASARRAFTVALLDEAMQIADAGAGADSAASSASASALPPVVPLPQLPIVLLDLIAQFHSFDLPYLPDLASAQLKSAGWLPLPANRAGYLGHSMNPVEKANLVSSGADEILEPIELDEGMNGEGEDDEDDEDEEDEDDYED